MLPAEAAAFNKALAMGSYHTRTLTAPFFRKRSKRLTILSFLARIGTPRLKHPHHQVDHIAQAAFTLIRYPLHQILVQATIQGGNGHWTHSFGSKWFCLNNSTLLGLTLVFKPIPLAHLFSVRSIVD